MAFFRGIGGAGDATNDATLTAVTEQANIATTKASQASTSAANASNSATSASNSATASANSATTAEAAKTAAETARNQAEAAQEAIDGLYLGTQATNPTVDLNGDPVTTGDWYFNTSDSTTRIYDGSNWNTVNPDLVGDTSPQLGGTLDANGNNIDMGTNTITDTKVGQWDTAFGWGDHSTEGYLTSVAFGDLTSTPTTLSGYGITDAATSAQGALADSAVQPNDNISTLTNDSGYLTAETNDLTASVTWANVPDVNITQSSVTQHQAALSITESQISDLQSYLTSASSLNAANLTGTIDGGTY